MNDELSGRPMSLAMSYAALVEELDRVRELTVRVRCELLDVVMEVANRRRMRGGKADRFLNAMEKRVRAAIGLTGQIFVAGQK